VDKNYILSSHGAIITLCGEAVTAPVRTVGGTVRSRLYKLFVDATQPRSFADLLRHYRVAAGLTQEALAERARMSLAAIGKLERGARQRPYLATVALLAEALSLSSRDRLELERAANRGAHAVGAPAQDVATAINLPIHFSSFVGRERDLAKVLEMLSAHRLVTLVGAGGVGKTRLAIRAAEEFIASNPTGDRLDGVWLVDLSPLADAAMLPVAIGFGIGINQCRTIDALVLYLQPQSFLLILDNCEHVLDPVAQAVETIISHCPNGRVLATSRQALSIEGERVYRVSPLSLPPHGTLSANAALQFDAIRLFKDRAEATESRFELTDALVPAVTAICHGVDGIALAIELAAARANAFPPESIAAQIGKRLSLLAGGSRTSMLRHKTMHALFDWSYDLLDDREREVFRRSSIFASGFTLDLLCTLYAESEEGEIPSLLASLVDKSLVQCDILVGPRYRLLEPVRQYAREKLSDDEYQRAARSHALALLTLAEDFDSRLDVIPDRVWDDYIEPEQENFRWAIDWAFSPHGDATIAQRLAASTTATRRGFATGEVRKWIGAALETSGEGTAPHLRAMLALNAARAAVMFGPSWSAENDPEALIDVCRRALALQNPDDHRAVGTAQYWLGCALRESGHFDEADHDLREARTTVHSVGDHARYNAATTALGAVRYGVGDLEEAHALISESLKVSDEAGSDRAAADARAALAEIEFARGHADKALALNEQAMQFFRSHVNLLGLTLMLTNSAGYLISLERFAEARDYAAQALRRSRAIGITHGGLWAMQHLAAAAVFGSDVGDRRSALRHAARILGFVDEAAARRAMPRYSTEQQEYDKMLSALRDTLGEDEVTRLMAAGKTWSEERAIAEALALGRGGL
jgi:predicted ATPase/DNA-binding XRE family transcriptional regulator